MSSIHAKTKITLKTLEALKARGERFACVTAYDSTFAEIASSVGIEVLLVGDTLGITPPDIKVPKFVKNFLAESDNSIRGAFAAYARAVKEGSFPGPEHGY